MLRSASLLLCLLVLACDSKSPEPPTPPKDEPPESDTCMPGGLEPAHSVQMVQIPRGCRVSSGGTTTAPSVVRSAEELVAALECDANTERPTIDFAEHQLMLLEFSLSPGYGGSEVFDDGSKVTFVTRDQPPCDGDPMPMPWSVG
jgi:hypothetical protein